MDILNTIISSVVSITLTLLITKLANRRRIKYSADGINIIERKNPVDDLDIVHNGIKVERLTKSHVWLWNSGSKEIKWENVIEENPLAISFLHEDKILSINVIETTSDAVGFRAFRERDDIWKIKFSHWAGHSGALFEILHTSKKIVPKVTGTIDGLSPIKSYGRIPLGTFSQEKITSRLRWLNPLIGAILMAIGLFLVFTFNLKLDVKTILPLALIAPGESILIVTGAAYISTLAIPKAIRNLRSRTS